MQAQQADPTSEPDFLLSVVIGVRNGARFIRGCLESVYAQGLPESQFEVLVVDGRSEDATRAEVERFVKERGITNLRVLDNPRRTLAAAFNVALGHVRGTYVAKVDAQSRLSEGYFKTLLQVLAEREDVGLVGGRFAPKGDTPKARAFAQVLTDPFLVGPAKYRYTKTMTEIDTVYLGVYRRTAIEQVGEFDETLLRSEDTDFNFRLRRAGWKVLLVPSVHAEYYVRETFRASWVQFFGYAYWRTAFVLKHGLPFGLRQLLPIGWAVLHSGSLVGLLITKSWLWFAPQVVYLLAALVRSALRVRPPGLGILYGALLYPVIHAAYALGVIACLVRRRDRLDALRAGGSVRMARGRRSNG